MSPDQMRARRQAAVREAKHTIPVVGIIIGAIALGAIGYIGYQFWDTNINKGPGKITLRYVEAFAQKDWNTMKSLATPQSAKLIDLLSRLPQNPTLDDWSASTFFVDKVETKGNMTTVTLRKSKETALLGYIPFILVRVGENWKVDMLQTNRVQGQNPM